jgi:hypothetical protein
MAAGALHHVMNRGARHQPIFFFWRESGTSQVPSTGGRLGPWMEELTASAGH